MVCREGPLLATPETADRLGMNSNERRRNTSMTNDAVFETAQATQAAQGRCQDRVGVIAAKERIVIVVADGACGVGGGGSRARRRVPAAGPDAGRFGDRSRELDASRPAIAAGDRFSASTTRDDDPDRAARSSIVFRQHNDRGVIAASDRRAGARP